jgi:hypothetical protein
MTGFDSTKDIDRKENKESADIMSTLIRCGKRTYFFDLKASKNSERYLTLTESKRHVDDNNDTSYIKQKIFILERDLKNFHQELGKIVEFIEANAHLENSTENENNQSE